MGNTSNISSTLSPLTKDITPTPTERKKRFAKIREKIKGSK